MTGLRFAGVAILAAQLVGPGALHDPPFTMLAPLIGRSRVGTNPSERIPVTLVVRADSDAPDALEVMELTSNLSAPPRWKLESTSMVSVVDGALTIFGWAGAETLLVLRRPGAGGYALDGPFRWPDRPDSRTIELRPRRTLRGTLPAEAPDSPAILWLDAGAGLPEDNWPICAAVHDGGWECIGVPRGRSGVALFSTADSLFYGIVGIGTGSGSIQRVKTRKAAWGRLIRVVSDSIPEETLEELHPSIWKPVVPRWRGRSVRTSLEKENRAILFPLGSTTFWLAGSQPIGGSILQIEGRQIATARFRMDDWQAGPPELPVNVAVNSPIPVAGSVLDANGLGAPGALVVVNEMFEEEDTLRTEKGPRPPRRRVLKEITADSDGRFIVPGLGRQEYEFLAVHESLGRVSKHLVPDGKPVVLRLVPPKKLRGRVVREGQAMTMVPVRIVPDLAQLVTTMDPVEHLAMDTVTDDDGRFLLALPPGGAGELRIGWGDTGVVRVPLHTPKDMPSLTDLGEIELRPFVALTVMIQGWDSCDLYAAGPIGATGMEIVRSTRKGPGERSLVLPEAGRWWMGLSCEGHEIGVEPQAIEIPSDMAETTVHLVVR